MNLQAKGHLLKITQNEEGNLAITLVFSLLILILSMYATMPSGFISSHNTANQIRTETNIQLVEYNLVAYLNNPLIWQKTFSSPLNSTLTSCFTDSTFDCPRTPLPLVITDEKGLPYYDASDPNTGFDKYGNFCSTFNRPVEGLCKFQFQISWTPQCPAVGLCNAPPILVKFALIAHSDRQTVQINPVRYGYLMRLN
jgi:hypothetical protein